MKPDAHHGIPPGERRGGITEHAPPREADTPHDYFGPNLALPDTEAWGDNPVWARIVLYLFFLALIAGLLALLS